MRVFIWPTLQEIASNNGIGRVVHAQHKYLPQFGITPVPEPSEADLFACHTQQAGLPRVDVLHCHGIYWTGDPGSGSYSRWHHRANHEVMSAARRARTITVPSSWVAEPFKRDMRLSPTIIGHGIDIGEWSPGDPGGYALWNKNRAGDVCDPFPALKLSQLGIRTVSTFIPYGAHPPDTMTVTGALPHERMRELIRNASVYLATVKETFGIGTLEAMACGVPVLGFRWGGTEDLVIHKETGYLADPGAYDQLADGYHYILQHRSEMSAAAREFALQYTWESAIEKYANLYKSLIVTPEPSGVSVVITSYNYASYVGQAIDSVLHQTYKPDEIIIVDDGSTDDTQDVLARYGDSIRVIRQQNLGVAEARNNGIRASTQPYIVCLDADDMLAPMYVEVCRNALMSDRGLGIAYTGLSLIGADGTLRPNAWPPAFEWEHMTNVSNPPSSCIPVAAMFRKAMWERAGGYRQVYAPGEDTEFWVRGLSVGFSAAKVWDDGAFWYRPHSGSASRTKVYKRIDGQHPWMRDKKYPMAAPSTTVPNIRSYSAPIVSVIIPVGDGHEQYVSEAIESLLGQEFRNWEVIVIDDTRDATLYKKLESYPFARVYTNTTKDKGPGGARNLGLSHVRAPLTLFLDADDYLHPEALLHMLTTYSKAGGRYVYTDWVAVEGETVEHHSVPDYNEVAHLRAPQHGVTVLIDTEKARDTLFDTRLMVLEDWDFFARCAIVGYHGTRLPEPLLYVRVNTGTRTKEVAKDKQRFIEDGQARYVEYKKGNLAMGSCCGGGGAAVMAAKLAIGETEQPMSSIQVEAGPEVVRMEYIGERKGATSWGGSGATPSGKVYRGGKNAFDRFADVQAEDVDWMLRTTQWAVVPRAVVQGERVPVVAPPKPQVVKAPEPVKNPEWVDDAIADEVVEAAAREADEKPVARKGRKKKSE